MSDYTSSKFLPPDSAGNVGKQYPENSTATPWRRVEPIISPEQVRSRYLFGIPLYSKNKNPVTNRPDQITDTMLQDYIDLAVNQAEVDLGIDIMPVKYSTKQSFDKPAYESFGFFQLEHRPVSSIDSLTVCPSNGIDIYTVPLTWLESAYMVHGQINIIPLTLAETSNGNISATQSGGGAAFLNILGSKPWVPAYWRVEYSAGFTDGMIPSMINEIIGIIVAQKVLSMLGATNIRNSASLGIDGLSQSTSSQGPAIYAQRLTELAAERKLLTKKMKKVFYSTLVSGHI